MQGPVANKNYVLNFLNTHNLHALKKYGQNFLIDDDLAQRIVKEVENNQEALLLEIGPGLGALTYHLVKKSGEKLLVEIDPIMCDHLKSQINDDCVKIVNKDFLQLELKNINKEIIVVGNLPYYITTDILEILLFNNRVRQITLMVQKEAYERLTAPINSKKYSAISVFLQYVGGTHVLANVSRHAFIPEPHVDSVVFQINVKKVRDTNKEKEFFAVTKAMFLMRRKTILNNLSNFLKNKQKAETILKKLNCPLNTRPEQLSLDFYLDLAEELF